MLAEEPPEGEGVHAVVAGPHAVHLGSVQIGSPGLQSINRLINQSINPSINQSINPSINPSINQSQSISVSQSFHQSVHQSINQSINHSIIQSFNQSISQSIKPLTKSLIEYSNQINLIHRHSLTCCASSERAAADPGSPRTLWSSPAWKKAKITSLCGHFISRLLERMLEMLFKSASSPLGKGVK